MTLEKAILEIDTARSEALATYRIKRANALGLGIEALKDIQCMHLIGLVDEEYLLPGQTKE